MRFQFLWCVERLGEIIQACTNLAKINMYLHLLLFPLNKFKNQLSYKFYTLMVPSSLAMNPNFLGSDTYAYRCNIPPKMWIYIFIYKLWTFVNVVVHNFCMYIYIRRCIHTFFSVWNNIFPLLLWGPCAP